MEATINGSQEQMYKAPVVRVGRSDVGTSVGASKPVLKVWREE